MSDYISPAERDGCWLCDGCGEIETHKPDGHTAVTVGCPVCVENDHGWLREKAEAERDALAAHAERLGVLWRALLNSGDGRDGAAIDFQDAFNDKPKTSLTQRDTRVTLAASKAAVLELALLLEADPFAKPLRPQDLREISAAMPGEANP